MGESGDVVDLNDKVAIITGGGGSLGKAFATKLLQRGAKICLLDNNLASANEVADALANEHKKNRIFFTHCDVRDKESFQNAVKKCKEEVGQVFLFINNAGVADPTLKNNVDTHMVGTITGTGLALEEMRKDRGMGGGIVVNVAGTGGLIPLKTMPVFAASNAGIVHYTRSIGHSFHHAYTGVRVQCLCPALVDNNFFAGAAHDKFSPEVDQLFTWALENYPRVKAEEVADGLLQLINDGKTGAVLAVDYGKKSFYVNASLDPDPAITEYNCM